CSHARQPQHAAPARRSSDLVVMGVEVSIPFGCTMTLDIPSCDVAKITKGLDELHDLGVRQMELVNKFDNALAGVAGDVGAIGPRSEEHTSELQSRENLVCRL